MIVALFVTLLIVFKIVRDVRALDNPCTEENEGAVL